MFNYDFIGWCNDGKHDKVYVVIPIKSHGLKYGYEYVDYLTVWGRRGKKLQCQLKYTNIPRLGGTYEDDSIEYFYTISSIATLVNSKIKKGYQHVDRNKLDQVYPEFEQDLEKLAIWESLKL